MTEFSQEAFEQIIENLGRVVGAFGKGLRATKVPEELVFILSQRYLEHVLSATIDPERGFLDSLGGKGKK